MSDNFLSELRRQRLIKELIGLGCNRHQATEVATFPTADADTRLCAHASIMADAAKGTNPEQSINRRTTCISLSAACFDAISKEAEARGMSERDFPKAGAAMARFIDEEPPVPQDSRLRELSTDQLLKLLKGKVN